MSLYQLARAGDTDELTAHLTESDKPTIRARAAELLGEAETDDDDVVDALIAAVRDDPDPKVQRAAVDALDQLGREPLEALIAELSGFDRDGEADWAAAREYTEFLSADQPELRMAAATVLGRVGDEKVVGPLKERFEDPDPRVRARAVRASGQIGTSKILSRLATILTDDDSAGVRQAAAAAIGAIGANQGAEALAAALDDPNSDVRRTAVAAMGELGDPSEIEAVVTSLADDDEAVRQAAAFAVIELLATAPADRSHDIRESIVDELGAIDLTSSVFTPLLDILESGAEASHRRNVVWLLGRIAGEEAPTPVVDALTDALGSSDESIGRFAATSLVEIGGEAVESTLIDTLTDDSLEESTRAMAAFALGKVGGERARDSLEAVIEETESETVRQRSFTALSKLGPDDTTMSAIKAEAEPGTVEQTIGTSNHE